MAQYTQHSCSILYSDKASKCCILTLQSCIGATQVAITIAIHSSCVSTQTHAMVMHPDSQLVALL